MKKYFSFLLIVVALVVAPTLAAAKTATVAATKAWKPVAPKGYSPIDWAKAPGIASYYEAPSDNGAIDFLTRIYLPQNAIGFILSVDPTANQAAPAANINASVPVAPTATAPGATINVDTSTAPVVPNPTDMSVYPNLSFSRLVAEAAKAIDPSFKFIWDAAFFNMRPVSSDLSMAVKFTGGGATAVSSGSRSDADMSLPRRMLLIDNKTGKASIQDFDAAVFADPKSGDQAIEGFTPAVVKTDGPTGAASRLFVGVSNDGKELTVYCSQSATVKEASDALAAAGASIDHQLEADGGASAACGYNLPGQFFVEPTRTLPLMMGAKTIVKRGVVAGASLNVRSGPGTKYPIVAKLAKNDPVIAYGELSGWYRIGDGQWAIKTLIK